MKTKHTIPALASIVLAGALVAVAPAASGSRHATLVIHHQVRGCHSWSLNGGAFRASQSAAIARGGSIVVTNDDVMPHKLVETAGPGVVYTRVSAGTMGPKGKLPPAMLGRMGSASRITFSKPGTYRFTTKPGEDFMAGMKTIGEDNVLRLTVRVS